ncbi:MAG TPA: substrate-binding domain-containing protein [Polyangia bacterium]|nr:substrate-binding domain-containing protein [Polyangia bacterium]
MPAATVIALLALAGATPGGNVPLRVCADPNNMPFSSQQEEGLENALARLVADALGAPLQYTWHPQRRGFVRNTLKAGLCDVMLEAPVGYERATETIPYYRSSYVFVSRRDRHIKVRSFDDPALRGLRIGVQVIGDDYANSPPAEALGRRGLVDHVVGFPVYGDYGHPNPLAPIVEAVARGTVDVAVVWGPTAGWFAKSSPVPLAIVPIAGEAGGLQFAFDVGMGVRRGDEQLRRRLDDVIRTHRPQIAAILRRYGVPLLPPGR